MGVSADWACRFMLPLSASSVSKRTADAARANSRESGRLAKFMGIYGKVFRNSELRLMARMYHVAVREAMLHGRQSLRLWEVRILKEVKMSPLISLCEARTAGAAKRLMV